MELKHFTLSEFDSPDQPGSGKNMQPCTLQMLDLARSIAGVPFVINSGFRTVAHNDSLKNSVPDSAHTLGYAADIRTKPSNQNRIISACEKAGFPRIGIYRNFIHVDNDPTKPSPARWNGGY